MTGSGKTVLFAFDKFRGTATSIDLAAAGERAACETGWESLSVPLADGGEGSLDALGGANKRAVVAGPLGDPVEAGWRLDGRVAYIEMATASGLELVGGADGNDVLAADTTGTGELIAHAVGLGARTVYVFLGGSATTDGGLGALKAMPTAARMKEIELVIATDVRTTFTDAARIFGPQKGAGSAEIALLERRLERLAQVYADDYGIDVADVAGSGAAGGLAGGLMALGGQIEPGFDVIAERVGLDERIAEVDLVVTGEGYLDEESFNGKVVGGVASWTAEQSVPALAIVGDADEPRARVSAAIDVVVLAERFGLVEALADPVGLVEKVVAERLDRS